MRKFLRKARLPTQPELSPLSIPPFPAPSFLGHPPIQTHLLWGPWNGDTVGREPGGGQGLAREWEEEFEARSEHSQKAGHPLAPGPSEPLWVFKSLSTGSAPPPSRALLEGARPPAGAATSREGQSLSVFPWTGLCCPWSYCLWNPHMDQLCKGERPLPMQAPLQVAEL